MDADTHRVRYGAVRLYCRPGDDGRLLPRRYYDGPCVLFLPAEEVVELFRTDNLFVVYQYRDAGRFFL